MAKRVGDKHDSTQEVSARQVLPPTPPAGVRSNPQNDVSMWIGGVVGSDDFSVAQKRPKRRAWVALAIGGLAVVGGAIAYFTLRETDTPARLSYQATSASAAAGGSAQGSAAAGSGAVAAPSAVADAGMPADASAVAIVGDGGVVSPAVKADAISSVGQVIKKSGTRPKAAKTPKTAKKKTASKTAAKKTRKR